MHRHATYPYSQPSTAAAATQSSRYPATSSAFSASANPNEDWTKISDLAERRRIQNRIAQRNYRKKLKKRLEDLERRAASNSASPEQEPAKLQRPSPQRQVVPTTEVSRELSEFPMHSSESHQTGFMQLPEDRLFAQPYARQVSTSPTPYSYTTVQPDSFIYPTFSSHHPYSSMSSSCSDMSIYSYSTPFSSPFSAALQSVEYPIKQELYPDNDLTAFDISYSPLPSMDLSTGSPYADSLPQVIHPSS